MNSTNIYNIYNMCNFLEDSEVDTKEQSEAIKIEKGKILLRPTPQSNRARIPFPRQSTRQTMLPCSSWCQD